MLGASCRGLIYWFRSRSGEVFGFGFGQGGEGSDSRENGGERKELSTENGGHGLKRERERGFEREQSEVLVVATGEQRNRCCVAAGGSRSIVRMVD